MQHVVDTAHFISSKPLEETIKNLHEKLLLVAPAIDRIACVLHDPATDLLKTFINSTRKGIPITGYEFRLSDSSSLGQIAESGECRVIDNISDAITGGTPHSNWLLEQGYKSSFTVPIYDMGVFIGLLFFDSMQTSAFTVDRQRDILMYANLLVMAITSERNAVRSIITSANVVREVSKLRDFETGAHLERMAHYSRLIAQQIAPRHKLNDEQIEHIFRFAPLHDIGKIGIPDAILLKPGRLTEQERRVMQTHVTLGVDLAKRVLSGIQGGDAHLPDSDLMMNIIWSHHEFMDGSGYPRGLRGDEIPIEARIVTVADIFDALTSHRPYKDPWPISDALQELERLVAEGKLDPHCVAALRDNTAAAETIRNTYTDD